MIYLRRLSLLIVLLSFAALLFGCVRKNPPRDEIPRIQELLGKLQKSVAEQNAAAIDSLIIAESYSLGYSSAKILSDVYGESLTGSFFAFGRREFFYTKDKAVVSCFILADSADTGRPLEIILVKAGERWYLKRFDLK